MWKWAHNFDDSLFQSNSQLDNNSIHTLAEIDTDIILKMQHEAC